MKTILLLLSSLILTQATALSQVTHPYINCPDVNIAIVRAGTNSDILNPYFLYNVNQTTGAMTLVPGGPYKDPANPTRNLQVNGVGVSSKDGFIYGIAFDGTATTARFVRLDGSYGVTDLGAIPSPTSGTGLLGIVNPAAGEMDADGNFYFSAFTFNPLPSPTFDKFYIGKIANTQSLITGPPVVQYFEVDVSGANCSNYISTLSLDPNNSGLKDFSFNSTTNSFFTYATYKLPGASSFSAQLLELVQIPGSSPLRYRLVCNATVNTHTAETSGTIIDKNKKFTVLFTDGSFGMLNQNASGVYTGAFTMITTSTGLPNPLRGDMGSCGQGSQNIPVPPTQPTPFPNCPDVDIAIVRAGTNANITNPYFLYNVNQSTGAMTLVPGGPYKDPSNPTANLQVNGIGVSRKDGFIYGIAFDGTTTTARFMRLGANYGATDLGAIPSPSSPTGMIGIVNPAAGDMDTSGNFYFSAFTANLLPTPSIDKLFIGKISNTQSMAVGPPVVQYFEVDASGANCSNYISTLTTDPNNSGLKDFSYNSKTNTFFTYATYKLPGASNFSAQLLELAPITGSSPLRYRLICNPTVNTHTAETAGTLIDKNGKFTVLFTDGSFGMLNGNASSGFSGGFTMITTNTGLPNPLRGDMGSCGQGSAGPPATTVTPFTNCPDVDVAVVRAGTNADVTNPYFLYLVNQSTGAMTLVPGGPFKDPADPSVNLQVNGIGVSRKDGFIYGIAFNGGPGSTTITARFMRLGANYGAVDLGVIPPPAAGPGLVSIVNTAAGDMDTSGNYYFSAFTINPLPTPTFVKFYLGKIANTQSMTSNPPVVEYFEVDVSGANCSNYISTLTSDPNNSGLKDFSYNSKSNSFFTYATYKLPGASNFSAQLLELVQIPGSSPLRYRLVCNPTVNTHTTETAGTLIDKNGKFTVLFTDGSFGMLNGNASSGFNGNFTLITASTGLPNPLRGDMGSCGQGSAGPPATTVTPFTNCPDVDVAVVRAGTNSDVTNPYFLYLVNQSTGAMTLVPGGPFKDPANPAVNLQVNGIGVSRKDGFIYGIAFNGGPGSTSITARFMRLGANYGAVDLGVIPPPAAGPGLVSIVNTAAGDMDTSGNYYFSAFTINPLPTPTFVKFYLGKIANTQLMTSGPPVVEYYEVDVSGANCANYISTLTSDPNNSGLKDFSYNSKTNTFFTYATYKLPGASNFSAQLLELVPISGSSPLRYRLVCNSTVNTHTTETAGTLIDKNGKFTVLFTDGSFGMLNGNASSGFNGNFTLITASTGLPNPLRGDMGSCGQGSAAVGQPQNAPLTCPLNIGVVRAGTNADITNPYSLYTVNGTTGAFTLIPGGPLLIPGTSQSLQLNGIGINKGDEKIYGMVFEGSLNTAKFVKVDGGYNVTLLGNIPPPKNSNGTDGFVNPAAGTIDKAGNFFFTAVTTKPGNGINGMVLDKLWIGKIADVASVTGTPTPVYSKVDLQSNSCKDFVSSLTNDPINSGFKDLFYHPVTKSFFTYVTYKLPGDNQFRGQMLELKPKESDDNSHKKYELRCKNVINMHNAETSGTMVTDEGEFLVLMTDGTVGRIARTGATFDYSGTFVMLNGSTGLPSPLRGDLASCTNLKKHHGDNDDDDDDDQGEDEDDDDQGDNNNHQGHDNRMNCSLYPNPVGFSQNVTLRWTQLPNPMLVNVLIYDNNGTIVRRVNNAMAVQGSQLSINVGNLASGLYYVRVISADGQIEHKLKFIKAN